LDEYLGKADEPGVIIEHFSQGDHLIGGILLRAYIGISLKS